MLTLIQSTFSVSPGKTSKGECLGREATMYLHLAKEVIQENVYIGEVFVWGNHD